VSILKENGINHIPIIVGFKKEMLIDVSFEVTQ